MVASEIVGLISNHKTFSHSHQTNDFADKLCYKWTPLILTLCVIITGAKQYIFSPIACTVAKGIEVAGGLISYVETYCWAHGTLNHQPNDLMTNDQAMWSALDNVSYYQWIPFVLGLQAIVIMIPQIFWHSFMRSHTGGSTPLDKLITSAKQAAECRTEEERIKYINYIARILNYMFYYKPKRNQCCSRLVGNWIFAFYLLTKIISIANILSQFYLMAWFLQLNDWFFGYSILRDIIVRNKKSTIFPLDTKCIPIIAYPTHNLDIFAQCVLPVNILNEKIFIFIWWWLLLIIVVKTLSIFQWIYKLYGNRSAHVRTLLKVSHTYDPLYSRDFMKHFLKKDGQFFMEMMANQVGDVITIEVLSKLFQFYKTKCMMRIPKPPPPSPQPAVEINGIEMAVAAVSAHSYNGVVSDVCNGIDQIHTVSLLPTPPASLNNLLLEQQNVEQEDDIASDVGIYV